VGWRAVVDHDALVSRVRIGPMLDWNLLLLVVSPSVVIHVTRLVAVTLHALGLLAVHHLLLLLVVVLVRLLVLL